MIPFREPTAHFFLGFSGNKGDLHARSPSVIQKSHAVYEQFDFAHVILQIPERNGLCSLTEGG